eukprot:6829711-Pyramimonas_sp.AAC.1
MKVFYTPFKSAQYARPCMLTLVVARRVFERGYPEIKHGQGPSCYNEMLRNVDPALAPMPKSRTALA